MRGKPVVSSVQIRILAALIAKTAESKSVKDVIDVGAGQVCTSQVSVIS